MKKIRLRYLIEDIDRHGNVRTYFRKNRLKPKIRMKFPQGSQEFMIQYSCLLNNRPMPEELLTDTKSKLTTCPQDTFGWLVKAYISSSTFSQLDPTTQTTRKRVLTSCMNELVNPDRSSTVTFRDCPLGLFNANSVRILRDRKMGLPNAANHRLKNIRQMFNWANEDRVYPITVNPVTGVKPLMTKKGGHHTWSEEEAWKFEDQFQMGTKARLAFALLMFLGVRRSDVVRLGPGNLTRDGQIEFTVFKNRNRSPTHLKLPILPELKMVLDATPLGTNTFLETAYGKPYTAPGFTNWFRSLCDDAGLSHCSAHGMRKAGATIAAENGATGHQLMSIFGWKNLAEAETYCRQARQNKMAREAMGLLVRSSRPLRSQA